MDSQWDYEYDFIVVGSGGGGMTAAVTADVHGMKTLVLEKSDKYGGTTALSGGVIWIPNHHKMSDINIPDSEADAWNYLNQVVSDDVPDERLRAYVQYAPQMLKFLEQNSLVHYDPARFYPDYYAELEGGKPGGRSMDPKPYSIRKLGERLTSELRFSEDRDPTSFSMTAAEAHEVFGFTWRSHWILIRTMLIFWLDLPRRLRKDPDNRLTLGRALVSRLRKTLDQRNVDFWMRSPVVELVKHDGDIQGVVVDKKGVQKRVKATKGVLFASGGFANNAVIREKYHPQPTGSDWTAACPTDTGDAHQLGEKAGAQLGMMDYVWWSPTMKLSNGQTQAVIVDKSMPGCVVVNQKGQRFCNEAEPYEDFVKHQYAANSETAPTIPAYFVFDARYRHNYPLGSVMAHGKYIPDAKYDELFESGWIKKADTLDELAESWGIDAIGLKQTIERFNGFAATGVDEDFGKGNALIDRYYSDHRVKPNPCLAPLMKAPFYAIQLWPGDLGTKGGLVADEFGRVLDQQGEPIKGLYVTGNASASVMGNSYPGAGSTIGPSMTFGYIASLHAAGKL